jgi:hypothetical protein
MSGAGSAFPDGNGEQGESHQGARHDRTGYQPQKVIHLEFVSPAQA